MVANTNNYSQDLELQQLFASILKSINRYHDQVIKGRPCIGIVEWRGNGTKDRANFPLPSTIQFRLRALDVSFFNDKLLKIAHDFVSKKLGSDFISVHLRTEQILRHKGPISLVVKCYTEMVARIQHERDRDPKNGNSKRKTFVAADFFQFGSHAADVLPARKNSGLLMTVIEGLLENPTFFDPKAYHLVDSGSVAIVELYILASGSQLFSVGGGAFQHWIRNLFAKNTITRFRTFHVYVVEPFLDYLRLRVTAQERLNISSRSPLPSGAT